MDQQALHVVVLAQLNALVACLLQIDGVGHGAVSADHTLEGVVIETESVGIDGGDHVDAAGLEARGGHAQVGPAGDTLEHDAVLLLGTEGGSAIGVVVHVLLVQRLHCLTGSLLTTGGDHDGHVVEEVKAVEGGGGVLGAGGGGQPCAACAAGEARHFLELIVVPLQTEQLLQLCHHIPELGRDVVDDGLGHVVVGVEGDVQHQHGHAQILCQILIPLDHAVADVVAAQHHIGHGHFLLGALLQLCVSQRDSCVSADVVGIAIGLCHVAHTLAGAAGGDTGCLVLGIHGGDPQRLGDLDGEVAGYPCHDLAFLLCLESVGVGIGGDFAQLVLGGVDIHRLGRLLDFFCHNCSSLLFSLSSMLNLIKSYRNTPDLPDAMRRAPHRWHRKTVPGGRRRSPCSAPPPYSGALPHCGPHRRTYTHAG